jgi:aspartate/methionine/tyrosine aminotransferase
VRVDDLPESPILSLVDRIFALKRAGTPVLGLHIGEPDFDTPEGIRRAGCEAMERGETKYAPAQGMPDLREGIARWWTTEHRLPCTASEVVVLPAKFALYAALLSTVEPEDEVLLPDPTYLFDQPVRLAGARPVYVRLREDFALDTAAIERAITSKSRVLILVTPSNPTGHVYTREELSAALEIARRHHLTLISDETYESLVYGGRHLAAASLANADDPIITVGSFSKRYAMTGWRAGYAIAPPAVVKRLVRVMEHTLTCLPPFIQAACLWALEHGNAEVERFRREFESRRDRIVRALAEVPGIELTPPGGAFYVFPRYALPMSSTEFCEKLLEEEHLGIVPGVAFGPDGEHHVRISFSRPAPELDEGVERLRRFLKRHAA